MKAIELRQLRNKLAAYWRVRYGGARRFARRRPFVEQVAAACAADPEVVVFELEGIVYDHVCAAWPTAGPPRQLLASPVVAGSAGLPEASLILLHSGLGLGLAEMLLRPLARTSPAAAFDAALTAFLELSRDNARPAYLAVARESLGLIVRMFRSELTAPVDAGLRRLAPDLAASFWHGAGRALYFLPAQLLPGGLARAAGRCRSEPPAAENRLDALAGLAFAVTMINLGDPRIVERLLALLAAPGEGEALTSGVVGGLLVRHHTTPADPALAAFLAWRPADPRWREAWERQVSGPGALALERLYPALRARGRLGDLARFQRLATLEESLREEERRCAP
ncbi:MAG TPA: hypothetical protein VFE33_27355 [Thermoanaerobaculia bacterium]|nr:hypothetical protein [Thermoanaerobaculia bacterium]